MKYSFIGKYLINVVWFRKSRSILIDSARQIQVQFVTHKRRQWERRELSVLVSEPSMLNWNSYFVGSKDRMCQLFQYYSRPELNWLSNIIYSLRSCPPYISIHFFSKTGKNVWSKVYKERNTINTNSAWIRSGSGRDKNQ